jgi:indolepyruvate ferredoxin oxidoreductase beta subunit
MVSNLNIIIAGVGGQGTILASRVLAQAALNAGLEAKTSETIGMAQREGSVQSHIRINAADFGPVIGKNQADILLGFEPAEAQRASGLVKPTGFGLVNIHPIRPVTVALGSAAYPMEQIQAFLVNRPFKVVFLNAFQMAINLGNVKTINAIMLGALANSGKLPFDKEQVKKALLDLVPDRFRGINERAFEIGSKVLEEASRDD